MAALTDSPHDLKDQFIRETRGMGPRQKALHALSNYRVPVEFVQGGKVVATPTGRIHYIRDTPDGPRCNCPARIKCYAQHIVEIKAERYGHDDPFPWMAS